ncbi:MAG: DUF5979 domain-containing protein [Bifidobacteriaceae bacterium]|nr:DUF5979 domain-containing protein [Bifidobacteriaceae bacterium]
MLPLALTAIVAVPLTLAQVDTPPASAEPHFLTVSASVGGAPASTQPASQIVEYEVVIGCSEADCVNATLTDVLPAELAGFTIDSFGVQTAGAPYTVVWAEAGEPLPGMPAALGASTVLRVNIEDPLAGDAVGLKAGSWATIRLLLRAPTGLTPTSPIVGQPIVFAPLGQASNAADAAGAATLTVTVAPTLAAQVTKSWSPNRAAAGDSSTITLTAANGSNAVVDSLTVLEPADPTVANGPFELVDFTGFAADATLPAGATTVQTDVFVIDGTGPGVWVEGIPATDFVLPAGVTASSVGGFRFTYAGELAVAGAAGAVGIEVVQRETGRVGGASYTDPNTAVQVSNTARAFVVKDGQLSAARDAAAAYSAVTNDPAVSVAKTMRSHSQNWVAQGNHLSATITAQNITPTPVVSSLTVADDLTAGATGPFGWVGWEQAELPFPAGADAALVTFYYEDHTDSTASVARGAAPPLPTAGKTVTGFKVVYTAPAGGAIEPNAQVTLQFQLSSNELEIAKTATNAATAEVVVGAEKRTASATGPIPVYDPAISTVLAKTISPQWSTLAPGQKAVTSLHATAGVRNGPTRANLIVITDVLPASATNETRDFWDAFDLHSIPAMDVPAGATLLIELWDGASWGTLASADNSAGTTALSFAISQTELTSLVAANFGGASPSHFVGIRFTFANPAGFQQVQEVNPYFATVARASRRDTGDSTGDSPGTPFTNEATAQATPLLDSEEVAEGGPLGLGRGKAWIYEPSDGEPCPECGVEIGYPHIPTAAIGKSWSTSTVAAQRSVSPQTRLTWDINEGNDSVVIQDPATPSAAQATTAFDTFDLAAIAAITPGTNPSAYTNNWAIQYDVITAIELWDGSAWQPIAPPAGTWMTAQHGFKGYTLSEAERASAKGVRIIVEADDAARAASSDPYAPAPGSGVTANCIDQDGPVRAFTLTFNLRAKTRSTGEWVIADRTYNYAEGDPPELVKSWIVNDVAIAVDDGDGGYVPLDTAADRIQLVETVPQVELTKTVASPGNSGSNTLVLPGQADPPSQSEYPTTTLTLRTRNVAAGGVKANAIRVTEPELVDVWNQPPDSLAVNRSSVAPGEELTNPFADVDLAHLGAVLTPGAAAVGEVPAVGGSFFERFNVTKLTIAPTAAYAAEVDLDTSVVWLLRYQTGGGAPQLVSQRYTATEANDLTAEQLADVIGVSVTFVSADPDMDGAARLTSNNYLYVTIGVQARVTKRVSGLRNTEQSNLDAVAVNNTVFAQSYDQIQFSAANDLGQGTQSRTTAIYLSGGRVGLNHTESLTHTGGAALTEPARDSTLTLTLGAASSNANLPATFVEIKQDPDTAGNQDFWNNVELTGLSSVTITSGPDEVGICAYGRFVADQPESWICSLMTPAADAYLPVEGENLAKVRGLHVYFAETEGDAFGPAWQVSATFTAQLRDETIHGEAVDFATSHTATVTSVARVSNDKLAGASASVERSASVTWGPGTRVLGLGKVANGGAHSVFPGDSVATAQVAPFTLMVENRGTGYLTLESLVDVLPSGVHLTTVPSGLSLGEPYIFSSAAPLETLSTTPEFDPATATFSWPTEDHANRLSPGEKFTITLYAWIEVGAYAPGENVTNQVVVTTAETLNSVVALGAAPVAWNASAAPNVASTTDYLVTAPGTSFRVAGGVKGSLGTASYEDPELTEPCVPTVLGPGATEPDYYAYPCVADSALGTVDSWVLHAVNTGANPVVKAVFFEPLPTAGDVMLIEGASRGSTYRPNVVVDSVGVVAADAAGDPVEAAVLIEVSTDPLACRDAWAELVGGAAVPCATDATWAEAGPETDWSVVTALRVTLEFAEALPTAGTVNITFETVNVPDVADPDGVSNGGVPTDLADATDHFAWSQFGAVYEDNAHIGTPFRVSPPKAGVRLATGSVEAVKVIDGPGADLAPEEFAATLACSAPWLDNTGALHFVDLEFGGEAAAELALTTAGDLTAQVDGLPLGATCQLDEVGEVGEFGEAERQLPAPVTLVEPGETVSATLVNSYDLPPEPQAPEPPPTAEPGPITSTPPPTAEPTTAPLPVTGFGGTSLLGLALGFILVGAGAASARRWRRSALR